MTWQDCRAADLVRTWNRSCTLKVSELKLCNDHTLEPCQKPHVEILPFICWPWLWQVIHGVMKVVYFLTRQKRSLAASLIVFSTQHVTLRLVWALTHYKQVELANVGLSIKWWKIQTIYHFISSFLFLQVRQAVAEGHCCFGTIDTWLLFKLTKGALGL